MQPNVKLVELMRLKYKLVMNDGLYSYLVNRLLGFTDLADCR